MKKNNKKTVEIPAPDWKKVLEYIKLVIDSHTKKSWDNGARAAVYQNLDAMAKVAQIAVDVAQKLELKNIENITQQDTEVNKGSLEYVNRRLRSANDHKWNNEDK